MNDKHFKAALAASIAFLVLAAAFCVFAFCVSNNRVETMKTQNVTDNSGQTATTAQPEHTAEPTKTVIVLDAGHGKPSLQMTEEEKTAEGYDYNEAEGDWGEWRHYKNGTFGQDCYGEDCTGLCPQGASCRYPMANGDRDIEPEIDLINALSAKKYLEEMGYEVRMTRSSNEENPSMNKRVSYCFPDNDISREPDAAAYVCIHSNAGGGEGTSYIALDGTYGQSLIGENYISASNAMGQLINEKIAAASGLAENEPISSPYLILFNKCPVPITYLEIGFFDNESDLNVLQSKSEEIGQAIAEGVDEYLKNN